MNILGKILVVLIFVMSIFFMAFSFMVFMTHVDWKTKSSESANQLRLAQSQNGELQNQISQLTTQRAAENAARKSAVSVLEARARSAEEQLRAGNQKLLELQSTIAQSGAQVSGSLESLKLEREKVESLRNAVKSAESDRDRMFSETLEWKNRVLELESIRERLESRQTDLVAQVTRQTSVLRAKGLDEFDDITNVPPPRDGQVRQVDGENKYVLLSLGSDDGISRGHQMDVFRRDKYLGRVQVTKIDPDRAVARVLDDFRKGAIGVGDSVRTK